MLPTRLVTAECSRRSRISDRLGGSALTLSARVSGYHTGSLQSRGKITTEPKVLPISVLPILRAEFQIVWAARLLLCQQRYQVTKSSRPALFKQRQNHGSELLTDSYLQLYFPDQINMFPCLEWYVLLQCRLATAMTRLFAKFTRPAQHRIKASWVGM